MMILSRRTIQLLCKNNYYSRCWSSLSLLQPKTTTTTTTSNNTTSNTHNNKLLLSSSKQKYNHKHQTAINNNNTCNNIQKRTMFIQTDVTPNPESLKFLPGRGVLDYHGNGEHIANGAANNNNESSEEGGIGSGTGFYVTKNDIDEISRSPLAKSLFTIDGIKSIYLGSDYITITKRAEYHWMHLKTQIFSIIMDFYSSGKPTLLSTAEITDTTILDDDDEIVAMIKELLETRIRPAVQEDGGDIRYVGYDDNTGVVTVKLAGSCVGCPSSSITLKNGVENMLMHYIPEVTNVIALEDDDEDDNDGSPPKTVEKSYEERLAAAGIPFSD